MELPNNITQIGAFDPHSKIYAEDYVISYMKKCNQNAADKPVGMAFYGRMQEEDGKKYYFFYGAAALESLGKDVTHLSQAQKQEIEKNRGFHFKEYAFLGYKVLDGTAVEGFYIYEQSIGRYVRGYATFAEKNDCMLEFMMDHEEEQVKPEVVDESKYKEVKSRQEQRREEAYYHYKAKKDSFGAGVKAAALLGAAAFGFLIYRNMDKPFVEQYLQKGEEIVDQVRDQVGTIFESEEMTPMSVDSDEVIVVNSREKDILVVEEELEAALQEENAQEESVETSLEETMEDTVSVEELIPESVAEEAVPVTAVPEQEAPIVTEPAVYIVQKGDTLISISMNYYGTKDRVEDICTLNHITNPDAIQEGWKIFLP